MKREIILRGLPASPGIAIGKAAYISQKSIRPARKIIDPSHVEAELFKLSSALDKTRKEMEKTRDKATKEMGEIFGRIFDSHLLILDDLLLIEEIEENIRTEKLSADNSVYKVFSKTYNTMLAQKKDYFRERADDVRDVGTRLLFTMTGKPHKYGMKGNEPVIIAARILTPSEIVHIERNKLLGVITDLGGETSHTAILARALEVPAVVGLKKASYYIESSELLIVNGNTGRVIINPSKKREEEYRQKQKRFFQFYIKLTDLKDLPAETLDHHKIKLMANIELPSEVDAANTHGADGIGLFRTEYLYLMHNQFPSEEEQFKEYKYIIEKMAPKPVTIRTFDLGGDKAPSGLETGREANPFMGFRAIRISLAQPEFFRIQLRAIYRASVYGKVNLMFPLLTGLAELRKIKSIIRSVKKELDSSNVPYDDNVNLGIMIETPSAVIMAPELAKETNFFSIGTNDLIQFTLAADRGNETIAKFFDNLHPAIFRMIKMTINAGNYAGIEVGMCGEMAGDPMATAILVGLGLNNLSVSPLILPEIKKIIRSLTYSEMKDFADKMMTRKTSKDIRNHSQKFLFDRFADLPIGINNRDGNG
ncbi:MAG: phosphoenolpyruvate--protein phosphotransferase [Candidatus Marinimicrobia bacterium]|nr:phosphoenolpyruvate--protein phosphotransferase [Candidatus Neomarinimicrobiota bacterium]